MQSPALESTPIIFGNSGLFGIRTTPLEPSSSVGLVMLNSGMLPCAGPFRLHVELARAVSSLGFTTVRLDQSGKGESPTRPGISVVESVLLDYDEVMADLARQGIQRTILVGMCSGAVDALRIADQRESVVGLVLLDGFVGLTTRWHLQRFATRMRNLITHGPMYTLNRLLVRRRSKADKTASEEDSPILTDLQNWGALDLRPAYANVLRRDARILAIFTHNFFPYNHAGQLRNFISPKVGDANLEELFFEEADHTYTLPQHRDRLIALVKNWLRTGYTSL
jgi:pimeloyl-ACP methyl ester carboxylesterase